MQLSLQICSSDHECQKTPMQMITGCTCLGAVLLAIIAFKHYYYHWEIVPSHLHRCRISPWTKSWLIPGRTVKYGILQPSQALDTIWLTEEFACFLHLFGLTPPSIAHTPPLVSKLEDSYAIAKTFQKAEMGKTAHTGLADMASPQRLPARIWHIIAM